MNGQLPASTYSKFQKALSWFVSFLIPVVLLLTSIRLLLIPGFVDFEYNMPGFPKDAYGFSLNDRLYWSRFTVEYLLNREGISYLGDLKFGDGSPVFNARELEHMVDVKTVVAGAMTAWKILLGFLFLLVAGLYFVNWRRPLTEGLRRGGWMALFLILGILVFVLIAFGMLFVAFHNIFFEPGTWTFLWSDTLIRLFPERFWRDMLIYIGLMTASSGLFIVFAASGFKLKFRSR